VKLGGGALLDVGVYPISFANMVYGGGKPHKIAAVGDLFASGGADQQVGMLLSYGHNRLAVLHTTVAADTRKEASIIGTVGIIKVHDPFWAPTRGIYL
jgi:dihydrodiol dehydrogenase / D-xylose 1-dehydrogenase (NADP)